MKVWWNDGNCYKIVVKISLWKMVVWLCKSGNAKVAIAVKTMENDDPWSLVTIMVSRLWWL